MKKLIHNHFLLIADPAQRGIQGEVVPCWNAVLNRKGDHT